MGSRGTRARQAAQNAARERRLREQRRRQQQQARRVSVIAVAVLLVAALAGVLVWQANRPGDGPEPAAVTSDGTGLLVGSGPVTVEIYLDFLCPACAVFDATSRPVLERYLAGGTVTLVFRPISILDQNTTTEYSSRAAAAAGCAAGSGYLDEFVALLMANQPVGSTTGFTDDEIASIAASAGITDDGFGQCVRDGVYRDWVRQATSAAFTRGVQGTPTVFVAGDLLEDRSPAALSAAIEAKAGR